MRKYFSSLWILGLVTLVAFPALSWPIFYLTNQSWEEVFFCPPENSWSILNFAAAGIIFGLMMIWMTELPYFEKSLAKYKNLLSQFKLNVGHVIFLSFCAGVGEEIFFRGAVQPLLGIYITAFIFVAIHGYFSVKNKKVNIFALALTCFIMLLGWAAKELSLWHAIAGHFAYDLVLLAFYRKTAKTSLE